MTTRPNVFQMAADNLSSGNNDPRVRWRSAARADQLQPSGDWDTWLVRGGRGAGKTRTGAGTLVSWILDDNEDVRHEVGDWGIIGPTYSSAWTVCVEGESGLLAAFGTTIGEVKAGNSKYIAHAWRSHGEIRLRSGDKIYVDSANDGADRVQGKNLKGVWCDELGMWVKWEQAWDEAIKYACRKSGSRKIATTTPKLGRSAAKLIRRLLNDPHVASTRLRTVDNSANLSEAFMESVVGRAKGTRLEKQELEGELLDDVEGALWRWDMLMEMSVTEYPELERVFVGVDPSDGKESGDEQAYTVAGLGKDRKLYVLESWGDRISPNAFLRRAVDAAVRWNGTLVVEKNHGQAYLLLALQQVQKELGTSVTVKPVYASLGKRTRAEPVAALYDRRVVHHYKKRDRTDDGEYIDDGSMTALEEQMCAFTGATGERSPDRLDSLVWAITPMLNYSFGNRPKPVQRVRKWAAEAPVIADVQKEGRKRGETWEPPEVTPARRPRVREYDIPVF